jgi:hypothetical protein
MNNTGRKTVKGTSTSAPMVAKSSSKSAKVSAKASTGGTGLGSASPPSHEQIAMRSFEIYLSRGATPGHELDDWLQAVHELQG